MLISLTVQAPCGQLGIVHDCVHRFHPFVRQNLICGIVPVDVLIIAQLSENVKYTGNILFRHIPASFPETESADTGEAGLSDR